ncbi:MAG: hypothetical protein V7767_00080 [Leeuwenhoekiella sp.]
MKYKVAIENIKIVNELPGYWKTEDYKVLLDKFDVQDVQLKDEELKDYLFMAINDFDPQEAATIVLTYKLGDELNSGQIDQLSNDMLKEKVVEEYSDIAMHKYLFHINQLLFKAYNGTFPNTKASITTCSITPENSKEETKIDKETVIKALSYGISDHHIIKRLFEDHLEGKQEFNSAENIIWELSAKGNNEYDIITSEYWLSKDDFTSGEFEGDVVPFSENVE